MGWFSGSTPSPGKGDPPTSTRPSSSTTPPKDPISSLEPSLREYLQSQYTKSTTTTTAPPPSQSPPSPTPSESNRPSPPPSSDPRYAHLWSTYNPPPPPAPSDQEALTNIMRLHRTRKSLLSRAALENCSELHLALNECYRHGGVWGKLTNCRRQSKELDDCYSTQVRFLKALGYMSELGRAGEVEEGIQMHADRLWRELKEEERAAEERMGRKREGEMVVEGDWWDMVKGGWGPKKGGEGIGRSRMGGVEIVIEPAKEEEGEGKR